MRRLREKGLGKVGGVPDSHRMNSVHRTNTMINFAKQFRGANLEDGSLLPSLFSYRRKNKLDDLFRGELNDKVVKSIEDYVLPHFYRHASKMITILSKQKLLKNLPGQKYLKILKP